MNDVDLAITQALTLLGLALAYDEQGYIDVLSNLADPVQVCNQLVRMLAHSVPAEHHAELSSQLLASVPRQGYDTGRVQI